MLVKGVKWPPSGGGWKHTYWYWILICVAKLVTPHLNAILAVCVCHLWWRSQVQLAIVNKDFFTSSFLSSPRNTFQPLQGSQTGSGFSVCPYILTQLGGKAKKNLEVNKQLGLIHIRITQYTSCSYSFSSFVRMPSTLNSQISISG